MKVTQSQWLAVAFLGGILVTLLFELYWANVPYPGQLLVVIMMLSAPVVGMVLVFKQLANDTFTHMGRVLLGVVCFVSLVPLTSLVLRLLRVAFKGY